MAQRQHIIRVHLQRLQVQRLRKAMKEKPQSGRAGESARATPWKGRRKGGCSKEGQEAGKQEGRSGRLWRASVLDPATSQEPQAHNRASEPVLNGGRIMLGAVTSDLSCDQVGTDVLHEERVVEKHIAPLPIRLPPQPPVRCDPVPCDG